MARDANEAKTSRVRQTQRPETDAKDPSAAMTTHQPAPTLDDAANSPKQKPCESIRITT